MIYVLVRVLEMLTVHLPFRPVFCFKTPIYKKRIIIMIHDLIQIWPGIFFAKTTDIWSNFAYFYVVTRFKLAILDIKSAVFFYQKAIFSRSKKFENVKLFSKVFWEASSNPRCFEGKRCCFYSSITFELYVTDIPEFLWSRVRQVCLDTHFVFNGHLMANRQKTLRHTIQQSLLGQFCEYSVLVWAKQPHPQSYPLVF